ncbi:MAG: hypothetical protein ABIF10_07955, partial [Candidatus Woesearchaeota archaeon]
MSNDFRIILQQKKVAYSPYQWESVCSHLYDTIESYGDLKKFILSGTVNERIFSMKNILPDIVGLLTD